MSSIAMINPASAAQQRSEIHTLLRDGLRVKSNPLNRHFGRLIDATRPASLRDFDQIPMRAADLAQQARLVAPYLSGKRVVFVGDHDCTSLWIGLICRSEGIPLPSHMLVLDFDHRLLDVVTEFAHKHGFGGHMDVRLYNVFDPLPDDLRHKFDWYYCNPPYGSHNQGLSPILFVSRGSELVGHGQGIVLLPDDPSRSWTRPAMRNVQRAMLQAGWTITDAVRNLHRYHLDDDPDLASSLLIAQRDPASAQGSVPMPFTSKAVGFDEVPHFYGKRVRHPYPRYIDQRGGYDYSWHLPSRRSA